MDEIAKVEADFVGELSNLKRELKQDNLVQAQIKVNRCLQLINSRKTSLMIFNLIQIIENNYLLECSLFFSLFVFIY